MSMSALTGGASVLASHRKQPGVGSRGRGRSPHQHKPLLVLRNRQRARRVNTPLLRRIVRSLLADLVGVERYELCVHLFAMPEMVRLNETFLHHAGSTDVITFDHAVGPARLPQTSRIRFGDRRDACPTLHGEIIVCMDEAIRQARSFRTSWQSELVRYVVHGVLHLRGFDDQRPTARSKMKREENRLLRELSRRFTLTKLARAHPSHAPIKA